MKILYINQYFNAPGVPSNVFIGDRTYQFARRLVARGHEVDVLTLRNVPGEHEGLGWFVEEIEGVRVHWYPLEYGNYMGAATRIRIFARFALQAARRAGKVDADVIYASSGPLSVAIPAIIAKQAKRIPMVFEVRDLWPEAPRQLGVLTNPVALAAARALERTAYRQASHVVGLSPGMKDGIVSAGVPEERVSVIPNSCDLELFRPEIDGTRMREKLGLGSRFAFGYFGTMGQANGLGFVLDAAAELRRRGNDEVVFVLHGMGKERPRLEERKEAEGLENVIFSEPFVDRAAVPELVAAFDVALTIYRNVPILHTCSPTKMFDSFAAGRPVLTNMSGWLERLVTENDAGVAVRPDDPRDFADKAVELARQPARVEEMGRNARALAERRFSRTVLVDQLERILEGAIQDARRSSS